MSKHSDLASHVRSLEEIKDIILAMRNLAILEIHRITKLQENQKRVVGTLQRIAEDFFCYYPASQQETVRHATSASSPSSPSSRPGSSVATNAHSQKTHPGEICIVIGSERGFCGGFNESLLHALDSSTPRIAVGRKLHSKLADTTPLLEALDGPSAVEEIDPVVTNLIQRMAGYPGNRWIFAYNEDDGNRLEQRVVHPFELLQTTPGRKSPSSRDRTLSRRNSDDGAAAFRSAPLLESDPDSFRIQLMDQYLFALLYEAFYSSFMAENRQRLRHLESAVSRIENELEILRLKMNTLRQDEITEEIEVILLSVGMDEFA